MTMATAFIPRVMTMITTPAAAALSRNATCGRETQLNIWIGSTVNGAINHSNDRNGNSLVTGDGGRKAMKVSAPMVMMGAVSPMARAMPMITPVMIPAVE